MVTLGLVFAIFLAVALLMISAQGYNSNDPNNCNYETFLLARRRSAAKKTLNRFANPCASSNCKNMPGTYCQCGWAVSSCLGNRPDCPVSFKCAKCPPGYTCSGDGFAVKRKGVVAGYGGYVNGIMAYLRGGNTGEQGAPEGTATN